MSKLAVCSGCNRHVREDVCPFCATTITERTSSLDVRRVARNVLFAASTIALADCSSPSPQPLYGAVCTNDAGCNPIVDAGNDANDAALDATGDAKATDGGTD